MTHEELKSRIRRMPYDAIMLLTGKEMWKLTDGFDEELVREIVAKHRTPKGQRDAIRTLKTTRLKAFQELGRPVSGPPQYFEDWVFDIKTGVLVEGAPPVVNEIVYNIQTKKSAEAETTDISKYKALLSKKDADIASLKHQLEEKGQSQPQASETQEERNDEWQVELLSHLMYESKSNAEAFLGKVQGMSDAEITDVVAEWVKDNKISPKSCRRELWRILHAAKLYDGTESNYNTAMRNKQ